MLVPTLPFDYARLTDTTDRVRRTQTRRLGIRIRRVSSDEQTQ
jgi:hypothetical protein